MKSENVTNVEINKGKEAKMAGRLQDKVCIITGASSGMGAETARVFGREGAKVVLAARREDKGEAVAQEIRDAGGEAIFVKTDTLELGDLDNLVQTTVDTYGRIDVLINNAGTGNFFNLHEMDLAHDFEWTFNLFARSGWYMTKLVLPYMMEQNKGDILFTLSTAAIEGVPKGSAYSGAKAALSRLSKAICMGYGKYNIRSNTIMPGLVSTELSEPGGPMERKQTPYIPMHRPGTCAEIANAYVFLASDECRFMTGCDLIIDGGNKAGLLYPIPEADKEIWEKGGEGKAINQQ